MDVLVHILPSSILILNLHHMLLSILSYGNLFYVVP
nr:MAG TPA: hypothetical protein [Bacteriophage sp.]